MKRCKTCKWWNCVPYEWHESGMCSWCDHKIAMIYVKQPDESFGCIHWEKKARKREKV